MKKNNVNFSIFIIGSLFFVFGFVTWLNSVLIPFLQTACELNETQASLVNFAFYISYFVMAIPSSYILKKTGFSNGMALGLVIMAVGSILFVPAAMYRNYLLFLIGLFIQGTGLALLQTAANPYVTILGPIETAARRQSIMGVANKVAGMIGILILSSVVFSGSNELLEQIKTTVDPVLKEQLLVQLSRSVIVPYIIMTIVLIALMLFVKAAKLPEIDDEANVSEEDKSDKSIFAYPYLWLGILALFFYVGVEVVAVTYLIPYGDALGIPTEISMHFPIYALIALVIGYLLSILLVPRVLSQRALGIVNLILAIILLLMAWLSSNPYVSIVSVILLSFTHAILWPVIWPLSIQGLGKHTKLGSAFLIMSIAGGGVISIIYAAVAQRHGYQDAYSILLIAYIFMLFFVTIGSKIKKWS
jgi:glucose/galactose transporter